MEIKYFTHLARPQIAFINIVFSIKRIDSILNFCSVFESVYFS